MKKEDLKSFLKAGTDDSMMRLMSYKVVKTGCFIAIAAIIGSFLGWFLMIIFNRDMAVLGVILGSVLGGTAALEGTLLLPSFGGKAAQSFSENKPNVDIPKEENKGE
jgi:hypothetical protein